MGWTFTYKPPGIPLAEFFHDSGTLRWTNSPHVYTVLDSALVRRCVFYAAIERIEAETGKRDVWAAVFLVKFVPLGQDGCNFGWKDMDETMGPCEADCPRRILELLTPTDNEYANDWRARCWAKINRPRPPKLANGDSFKWGGRRYTVTGNFGRKGYQVRRDDGAIYRMPYSRMKDATDFEVAGKTTQPQPLVAKQGQLAL